MRLPSFRPDAADAAMLAVVLMWAVAVGLLAIAPWGLGPAPRQPRFALPLPAPGSLGVRGGLDAHRRFPLDLGVASRGVARTAPRLVLIPVATGIMSAAAPARSAQ